MMKKPIYLFLLLLAITGCQTLTVNNDTYKISSSTTEIGSIGHASSVFNLENNFATRSFPILEHKIRLDVQILPFTKKINDLYTAKLAEKQQKPNLAFADSLPKKPEFITVSIMDIAGYVKELNTLQNNSIKYYIDDTKKAVVVTGQALAPSPDDWAKIKQADSYYLEHSQNNKYTIGLYTAGKKTGEVNTATAIMLGYTLGKFCWSTDDREQWYIGDIVSSTKSCKGNTHSKIKQREETNLFKM